MAAPGRWETASLGLVLGFALAALALSLRYPLWEYFQPGPGLFPAITAVMAVGCAAGALVAAVIARRQQAAMAAAEAPVWRRLLVYIAIVLAWPLAFADAGFAVSSLVGLTLLLRAGEGMGWAASLGLAGVTVALGWLLFEKLLGVPLPHGLLPA